MRACIAVLDVGLQTVWPVHLKCLWRVSACTIRWHSFFVADGVRPVYVNDLSQAGVDEALDSFDIFSSGSPCVSSVE